MLSTHHRLFLPVFIATLVLFSHATVSAEENKQQLIDDRQAVLNILQRYNDALQALTTEGTFELFTDDAQVYEQGGVEGTYAHYVEHHLGPELAHFTQFSFSDYQADAEIVGHSALATQTYRYKIVTKATADKPSRTIEKQGLATSVLIKTDAGWKIKRTHSSSRAVKTKK